MIGGSIPKWRFIISMSLGGPQHPHGFTLSVHNIIGSTFRVPAFRSRRLVIASLKNKKVEGGPLGILGVVSETPTNRAVKFAFAEVSLGFKELLSRSSSTNIGRAKIHHKTRVVV